MSTNTAASTGTQQKTKKRTVKKAATPAALEAKQQIPSPKVEDDGEHIEVQAEKSNWGSWAMSPRDALAVNYVDHEL